jgi:hypothetical protein
MRNKTLENDVMARYLLGQLPEAEQEAFEEKLFVDDDCLDQLSVVEMELIDAYVHGRMSAKQQSEFERGFLTSPSRIQKVANAKALMRHVIELRPDIPVVAAKSSPTFWQTLAGYLSLQSPVMQYGMAAAVVLLTVGGLWLVYDRVQLRNELHEARQQQSAELDRRLQDQRAQLQRELEQKETALQQTLQSQTASKEDIERLNAEIQAIKQQRESLGPSSSQEVIAAVLKPTISSKGVEGDDIIDLRLGRATKSLRLRLPLPQPAASSYLGSMQNEKGEVVRRWNGLRANRTGAIVLNLSAAHVADGLYTIELTDQSGRENGAKYYVRILRN